METDLADASSVSLSAPFEKSKSSKRASGKAPDARFCL